MAVDYAATLAYRFAGNSVQDYLIGVGILIVSLAVLRLFKFVIVKWLIRIAKKTKTKADDIIVETIDKLGWFFYVSISLYFALQYISLHGVVDTIVNYAIIII
jgi:hypothetical protein